jgi:hypothetical protein
MVMEYCPDGDLQNTIVELQKLPEKERIIVYNVFIYLILFIIILYYIV